MEDAFEMAGYFCAHAIWCVADAETLVPMLAVQRPDRSLQMTRFEAEAQRDAVASARERLELNPERNSIGALFYDGYVTLPEGRTDAVVVELVEYSSRQRADLAVPYRHAAHPDGFAVFRPKLLTFPDRIDERNSRPGPLPWDRQARKGRGRVVQVPGRKPVKASQEQ